MIRLIQWLGFLLVLWAFPLGADELRPGFLEVRQTGTDTFFMLWKVPAKSGTIGSATLKMRPRLPENCIELTTASRENVAGALVLRQHLRCPDGLVGHKLSIDGLEQLQTDVLVRLEFHPGGSQTIRLYPGNDSFNVAASPSSTQVMQTYTRLGLEHILTGVDHLIFVLALLLIVAGFKRLLWTVTAFTLAHSITLVGATLGWFWLPSKPVEAVIALSILLLAVEIIHRQNGRIGATERWPWLVAFLFGLLHGFGFAGALSEVGLPEDAIPLALLFFNVGVEIGQVIFVLVMLLLARLYWYLLNSSVRRGEKALSYVIGSLAAFWTIERVAAFW